MTDELLIRFLLNETNEDEGVAVQEWLAADSSNLRHFQEFETIWRASKDLSVAHARDEQQAWMRFQQRAAATEVVVKPLRQQFGWLRIAAMLLLVGGAWMAYTLFGPESYKDLTAYDKVLTEQLPDGSELTLNKNAEISYAANFNKHRSVRLNKGEVFFNVAHDKMKPFVIDIDKVSVTVVGTSFNIKKSGGLTEVIVESGIVRVALGTERVELHKGEKISINTTGPKLVKEVNTDQLYNYYRSNLFIANNTSLMKLVNVMNEAYGSQIVVEDADLAAEPISTTVKVDDGLDKNLEVLSQTLNLKAERNENKILLSRNK